jgi:putative Flp pilus-assembly TadE/G-like protein
MKSPRAIAARAVGPRGRTAPAFDVAPPHDGAVGRRGREARDARRHHEAGQASVELVAFLPLLLLIALAVFSFAAAQAAREEAGAAAEAAALALLQGRDARDAAREALPPASRGRARIDIAGASVRVHLRARLPLLADRLAATEEAHAGP